MKLYSSSNKTLGYGLFDNISYMDDELLMYKPQSDDEDAELLEKNDPHNDLTEG